MKKTFCSFAVERSTMDVELYPRSTGNRMFVGIDKACLKMIFLYFSAFLVTWR